MEMLNKIYALWRRIGSSAKGHNVLLYLLFVCVAFVFWFVLSLDSEVQREFDIPIALTDVPDSVVMIGDMPQRLNVVVIGKSSQLLAFMWGKPSELKIKFQDNISRRQLYLSRSRLDSRIRDYFGQGVAVLSVRPDSIKVPYTTSAGLRVPVHVVADITPSLMSIVNGPLTCNVDSVSLYSNTAAARKVKYVETEPIVREGLRDTTFLEVPLKKIAGVRMIPDKVRIRIPVEPLISKKRVTPIDVVNMPKGVGFLTFPSTVEVSYLVPMSRYNDEIPFKVYVDYNTLQRTSSKIKVSVAPAPDFYHNITLSQDSVDYVLESQ